MKRLFLVLVLVATALVSSPLGAAEPLVDAAWVKANLGKPDLVMLDLRNKGYYQYVHIPGSVHSDYVIDGWRVKKGNVGGMLPDTAQMETLISRLGISNKSHVVLVVTGASAGDMAIATRVYWTFKVLGHDEVSILEDGITGYLADKAAPKEQGDVKLHPAKFTATLRPELIATKEDVQKALEASIPLIDNRPPGQFIGVNKAGSVKKAGTLPGAKNLPGVWITEDSGGVFRKGEQLKALFAAVEVPTEGQAITFCNTGQWASLGWFARSELLGNKDTKLYDGSMTEWTQDDKAPVEARITLP